MARTGQRSKPDGAGSEGGSMKAENERGEKLEIDREGNIIQRELENPSGVLPPDMTAEEMRMKNEDDIPGSIDEVKRLLEERCGLSASFDLVLREMVFGGRRVGIFYANGFAKDTVLTEVLKRLTYAMEEEMHDHALQTLFDELIPHIQVSKADNMSNAVELVFKGGTALFIEHEPAAIIIDAKNFPARTTEEPDLERVVRGARDGFVETLLTNVTLVRRRVRDPRLKLKIMNVGKRTNTDVCIGYLSDIANPRLIEEVRNKIKELELDGIPLAEKQLEEAIMRKGWNPYPLVRYTERPDVAAAHLLEGHVVIFVDTSPSAMILPTTFFHHVQHAEEYRQTPFVGTYLRWVRFVGVIGSLFVLPLWLLMVKDPHFKPEVLSFIGPSQSAHLPIMVQFLFAELGIDLMRMAAVHTPSPLATAMGLVAAVLVGEIAVKTGLFVNEVILYLAVAAIGSFATPSYELAMANRLSRLVFILATGLFGAPGFVISATLWVILLALQRSYDSPYLWPFLPFNWKGALAILIRIPVTSSNTRLSLTKPIDRSRQPQRQ
ncbi:stage V sporulation protein AF [Gordoniibacillus kamchatkensis]|uniref:Stage V sporulation protein AF n=2 Tax=Gordoniibacillus kamchatkensis TaxID=1590651 RepID=A0ABR5AA10_9BACL|nr:stage V sporulation protein AF [Paenibacillus sp. VKM B-2647]